MSLYDEALSYFKRGWNTLPLQPKAKTPLVKWSYLQEQRATKEELKRWFKDTENNIGIVTGKISNLTVVDCDNQEALDRYYFKAEPSGRSVKTPKGHHFYHFFVESRNSQDKGLDIRNEGGYIVAPPSENAKGERYEWESTVAMTKFNPHWFEETRVQLSSILNVENYDSAVERCSEFESRQGYFLFHRTHRKPAFSWGEYLVWYQIVSPRSSTTLARGKNSNRIILYVIRHQRSHQYHGVR